MGILLAFLIMGIFALIFFLLGLGFFVGIFVLGFLAWRHWHVRIPFRDRQERRIGYVLGLIVWGLLVLTAFIYTMSLFNN
ncbi:hypothetical protein QWJ34_15880 [Saccharibacillus sp. CPCC 101409]|uniref:hypothetical protein n=1 Tax=Saccharibacillus sp. CPCC 101409 TaxID=3058041 RepID=UPI00267306B1|nr:hypothetical protein [Saccharibacillus sp. CPCC 101409]MDO3411245.1 hypothetical protein [Saccharibacillus sp. CPCC 101409]